MWKQHILFINKTRCTIMKNSCNRTSSFYFFPLSCNWIIFFLLLGILIYNDSSCVNFFFLQVVYCEIHTHYKCGKVENSEFELQPLHFNINRTSDWVIFRLNCILSPSTYLLFSFLLHNLLTSNKLRNKVCNLALHLHDPLVWILQVWLLNEIPLLAK